MNLEVRAFLLHVKIQIDTEVPTEHVDDALADCDPLQISLWYPASCFSIRLFSTFPPIKK